MPYNDGSTTLPKRLAWAKGVCAYGTSAKGGTLAAYRAVEDTIIGGRLNVRRAFNGVPEPGDPLTIWSTKESTPASIADRHAAFAAYGQPCIDVFHHEPFPEWTDPAAFTATAGKVLAGHAPNVARALCFMRQDISDGGTKRALPTRPEWLDLILFDAYRDKFPGRTAKQLVQPCIDEAERLGIPWGLAETGVAGPALERIRFAHELVELACNSKTCVALVNFQSDIGARCPTNYDGSVEWSIAKSSDRYTPEMATLWRDMAYISRNEAARLGSPAKF